MNTDDMGEPLDSVQLDATLASWRNPHLLWATVEQKRGALPPVLHLDVDGNGLSGRPATHAIRFSVPALFYCRRRRRAAGLLRAEGRSALSSTGGSGENQHQPNDVDDPE